MMRKNENPFYKFKARYSSHLGHTIRSRLEEEGFTILRNLGIPYEHEKPIGYKEGSYRPDALIDGNVIIEFKGFFPQASVRKMLMFKKDWGDDYEIILVVYDRQFRKFVGWKDRFASDVIKLGEFYKYCSKRWPNKVPKKPIYS